MVPSRPDLQKIRPSAPATATPATDPDTTLPSNQRLQVPTKPPTPARKSRLSPLQRESAPPKKPASVGSSDPNPAAPTRIDAALDPLIGKVVADKYQVLELIAVGGMGKVYKAKHKGLDRIVCVKTLRPALLDDPTTVGRFEREAKAASRLSHANTIQVFDFGPDGHGSLYLAMEYVPGRDLRTLLLKEFPLGEARICRIMAQALSALAEAHRQGVVHRDLKPENIMVEDRRDQPDFVKVLDFGIAKVLDGNQPALTLADSICGTPLYMSPEQATGGRIDARTDVYACGVILYQLLTGVLPFYSQNTVEVLTRHVNERPIPLRQAAPEQNVTPELDKLVLRAMSKDPDQRPQTADEFRDALLAIADKAAKAPRTPRAPPQELKPVTATINTNSPAKPAVSAPPEPAPAPEPAQGAVREVVEDPEPAAEPAPSADELAVVPKSARQPLRLVLAAGLVVLLLGAVWWFGRGNSSTDTEGYEPVPTAAAAPKPAPAPTCAAGMLLVAPADSPPQCFDPSPIAGKRGPLKNVTFDDASKRCADAGKHLCAAADFCAALGTTAVSGLGKSPAWVTGAGATVPALARAGTGKQAGQCLVLTGTKKHRVTRTSRESDAEVRCCAAPTFPALASP